MILCTFLSVKESRLDNQPLRRDFVIENRPSRSLQIARRIIAYRLAAHSSRLDFHNEHSLISASKGLQLQVLDSF